MSRLSEGSRVRLKKTLPHIPIGTTGSVITSKRRNVVVRFEVAYEGLMSRDVLLFRKELTHYLEIVEEHTYADHATLTVETK